MDVTAARAGGGREFVLMRKPDARKVWNLRVHPGGPVRHQGQLYTRKGGLGVPLVAARIYYGVTAVIRFMGRRLVVSFEDGWSAS
jgi:hypothetical protein